MDAIRPPETPHPAHPTQAGHTSAQSRQSRHQATPHPSRPHKRPKLAKQASGHTTPSRAPSGRKMQFAKNQAKAPRAHSRICRSRKHSISDHPTQIGHSMRIAAPQNSRNRKPKARKRTIAIGSNHSRPSSHPIKQSRWPLFFYKARIYTIKRWHAYHKRPYRQIGHKEPPRAPKKPRPYNHKGRAKITRYKAFSRIGIMLNRNVQLPLKNPPSLCDWMG